MPLSVKLSKSLCLPYVNPIVCIVVVISSASSRTLSGTRAPCVRPGTRVKVAYVLLPRPSLMLTLMHVTPRLQTRR